MVPVVHRLLSIFVDGFFLQEGTKICIPLLIARLLSFFSPVPGISKTDAYITAAVLSFVVLIEAALHAPHYFNNARHGLHLRIAAASLLYRKVGIHSPHAEIMKHVADCTSIL